MSEPANPTSLEPGAPSEEEQAWARVLAAWADEAVHRAYLARFTDMDGYAQAGGRYRAVLAERPEDPMAIRMRDEILKKASVVGLASLPRTRPEDARREVKRLLLAIALGLAVAVLLMAAGIIYRLVGAGS
jgi:hypothetical protein